MANERGETDPFLDEDDRAERVAQELELPSTRAINRRDGDRPIPILEPASSGTDDLLTWLRGLPPEYRELEDVPDDTGPPFLDLPDSQG